MTTYVNFGTTTSAVEVYPTGPVSISKSSVTTTSEGGIVFGYPNLGHVNITVTFATLPADASVCDAYADCSPPITYNNNGISTDIYAPLLITNKPSCTLSSVSYTTSSLVYQLDGLDFPTLLDQATDTGSKGVALFVTTYTVTVDYNLGGQPILATSCSIWLKDGAVRLNPGNRADYSMTEDEYLIQCGDPRRYLCTTSEEGFCGTDWVENYPPTTTATTTNSPGETSRSGGAGDNGKGSMGGSGAAGRNGLLSWNFAFVGPVIMFCFFL
ncbi:hypothetical protein TWF694_001500 [Orbilia ellipsospora]|uniref:Uncharacterized protein n=1 Tax=Orbilia ellipsospora TaxID=2528407 RepID=A0AAV9XRS5_9PEZI